MKKTLLLAFATAFLLPAQTPKHAALLDINTATAEQLAALPGMGTVYAQKIIAGRPYSAKNQLASKGVLPQAVYSRIQPLIVARHSSPTSRQNGTPSVAKRVPGA